MIEQKVDATKTELDLLGVHLAAYNSAREKLTACFAMWLALRNLKADTVLVRVEPDGVTIRTPDGPS